MKTASARARTAPGLPLTTEILSGWGRYPRSPAKVFAVHGLPDARLAWERRSGLSLLGRGAGKAYGDAALNRGNLCLDFTPAARLLAFDARRGRLHAEAGATLEQILDVIIPRGFFLPVTPGTKYPTLGGAVACDVHGKSRHSLSHYLERLHLLLADGSVVACSPRERPELFWATVGGMGLTGLILSAELKLLPIESSQIVYEGVKARNLEEIFQLFEEDSEYPLAVAWIDCLARGRSLGRSIMMRGRFARRAEAVASGRGRNPLAIAHRPKLSVPFPFPGWSLNPWSVTAFNAFIYGKHPRRLHTLMDYEHFFYPLDSILRWNLIYGPAGLVQYQFLIPAAHGFEGVKNLLEAIVQSGKASFLAVLKKFGPEVETRGMLSFPAPGYFLALDFPVAGGGIFPYLDRWDRQVVQYGGRIYLAKDACVKRGLFREMYPRLQEWLRVKARFDPANVFESDLGRRLGLAAPVRRPRGRIQPRRRTGRH